MNSNAGSSNARFRSEVDAPGVADTSSDYASDQVANSHRALIIALLLLLVVQVLARNLSDSLLVGTLLFWAQFRSVGRESESDIDTRSRGLRRSSSNLDQVAAC